MSTVTHFIALHVSIRNQRKTELLDIALIVGTEKLTLNISFSHYWHEVKYLKKDNCNKYSHYQADQPTKAKHLIVAEI